MVLVEKIKGVEKRRFGSNKLKMTQVATRFKHFNNKVKGLNLTWCNKSER